MKTTTEVHIYQSGEHTVSKSSHHAGLWNVYHNQTGQGHALNISDEAIRILYPLHEVGTDKSRKYRTYEPGEAATARVVVEEMEKVAVLKGKKLYEVRRRKGLTDIK